MDKSYRILKWYLLLQAFTKNKLDVWYTKAGSKEQLFISNIPPGPTFRNIREYQNEPGDKIPNLLVRWLISGQLPNDSDKDVLFAIVRESKPHYEICGFCRKDNTAILNGVKKETDPAVEQQTDVKCETLLTVQTATAVGDGVGKVKNGKKRNQNGEVIQQYCNKGKRKATDPLTSDQSVPKRKKPVSS